MPVCSCSRERCVLSYAIGMCRLNFASLDRWGQSRETETVTATIESLTDSLYFLALLVGFTSLCSCSAFRLFKSMNYSNLNSMQI